MKRCAPGLLIAALTLAVFLPALSNDFVNLDDREYVYDNPSIRSLDAGFFRWVSTAVVLGHWHPLTNLTYAIDFAVWGLNPLGFHLTSFLFHALNTLLVFLLVRRLAEPIVTGNPACRNPDRSLAILAGVSALLFGIHPTRVESVAWIAERKDVVYGFFFLLSALFYVEYCKGGPRGRVFYVLSLAAFALSITGKAMAVTLPAVLLLLDAWPLRRSAGLRALVVEKLPFFLLGAAGAMAAVYTQRMAGALATLEYRSIESRIFAFAHAFPFYLYKTVVPTGLAPLYPYPRDTSFHSTTFMISVAAIVAVTAVCVGVRRRTVLPLFAWCFFVLTVLPVSGLLQAGQQLAADRYTYLTTLGFYALVGAAAEAAHRRASRLSWMVVLAVAVTGALLARASIRQMGVWKDSVTLWNHQIALFPGGELQTWYSQGNAHARLGRHAEAIAYFDRAAQLDPQFDDIYYNRGLSLYEIGKPDLAIRDFTRYLEGVPRSIDGLTNRGNARLMSGDAAGAVQDYTRAIQYGGGAPVYANRAQAFAAVGNAEAAIADYTKALELDPDNADVCFNRGLVYAKSGRTSLAIADFTRAIELNPTMFSAYSNRGITYEREGRFALARADYERTIQLKPADPSAYFYLGLIQIRGGDGQRGRALIQQAADMGLPLAASYLEEHGGR